MVNIAAIKNKKKNGAHICTTYSTGIDAIDSFHISVDTYRYQIFLIL